MRKTVACDAGLAHQETTTTTATIIVPVAAISGQSGVARTSPSSSSSPMSLSEAINIAKTSAEAEKYGDAPRAQANPVTFEPCKMEEEEEEEEEDDDGV
jgi:hypothetical protein